MILIGFQVSAFAITQTLTQRLCCKFQRLSKIGLIPLIAAAMPLIMGHHLRVPNTIKSLQNIINRCSGNPAKKQ